MAKFKVGERIIITDKTRDISDKMKMIGKAGIVVSNTFSMSNPYVIKFDDGMYNTTSYGVHRVFRFVFSEEELDLYNLNRRIE